MEKLTNFPDTGVSNLKNYKSLLFSEVIGRKMDIERLIVAVPLEDEDVCQG